MEALGFMTVSYPLQTQKARNTFFIKKMKQEYFCKMWSWETNSQLFLILMHRQYLIPPCQRIWSKSSENLQGAILANLPSSGFAFSVLFWWQKATLKPASGIHTEDLETTYWLEKEELRPHIWLGHFQTCSFMLIRVWFLLLTGVLIGSVTGKKKKG